MVAKTSTARSLCHGDAGIRLQSPSISLPSNPFPYQDHKTARVRARRAGDGSLERPLIIVCNAIRQQWMNLQ